MQGTQICLVKRKNQIIPEWKIKLPGRLTERAAGLADEVATRLLDIDTLIEFFKSHESSTDVIHAWEPTSLMIGFPGLAIMCDYFAACLPGVDWDKCSVQLLDAAIEGLGDFLPADSSMVAGLSGLGFALQHSARARKRHVKLLNSINDALRKSIEIRTDKLKQSTGVICKDYDQFYGITGIGSYLLTAAHSPATDPDLSAVLESLVARSFVNGGKLGFHVPEDLLSEFDQAMVNSGYVDCGLAHGIAGPLSLLALAARAGVKVPRLTDAIISLTEWLLQHSTRDECGIAWPKLVVDCPEKANEKMTSLSRKRMCRSSCGIARAIWLAGDATANKSYQQTAIEIMESVYRSPESEAVMDSPFLCHGIPGLLQITLRFAADTGESLFIIEAAKELETLLDLYKPDLPWGFEAKTQNGVSPIGPGLLYGAAGVVVSLLSSAYPINPSWDRALILS